MYIVIEKSTENILHIDPSELSLNLSAEEVYSGFDAEKMELFKSKLSYVPDFYSIDDQGFIVEKSMEDKVTEGIIGFDELFHFEPNPTTSDTGKEDDMKWVSFVIKNELIKSKEQCSSVFKFLDDKFENEVSQKYRPGIESKLMKDYIEWMEEGKPQDDKRQKKYQEMKAAINEIKEGYKPIRAELKKIMTTLKEQ